MTGERIVYGLSLLVLQLANGESSLPEGWTPHEWAYIRGLASAAILRMRTEVIVARGTPDTVGSVGVSDPVAP